MLRTFAQAAGVEGGKTVAFLTVEDDRDGGGMAISIRNITNMFVLDSDNDITANGRCVYDAAAEVLFATRELGGGSRVYAIDCADPSNMVQLGFIDIAEAGLRELALDEVNSVVYLPSNDDFFSVDVSDPTNMALLDTLTDSVNLNNTAGVALNPARTRAYVISRGTTSVVTVDISDPSNLSILGSYTDANLSDANEFVIDQSTEVGYVSATVVTALDCSGVTASLLSSVTLSYDPDDITLAPDQGVIYLSSRSEDSVVAIDVSNPSSISVISTLVDPVNLNSANRLEVDDARRTLFVVAQSARALVSVDVKDPSSMAVLDTQSTRAVAMFDVALA